MNPTNPNFEAVWGGLLISGVASILWLILLERVVALLGAHVERRPFILAMPIVGLLASVGSLASAVGFGMQTGILDISISPTVLSVVASMGRGALLMGGVIALFYYHPPRRE